MDEIWKDIEGWEGFYQVSNFARVKSLARGRCEHCGARSKRGGFLSQYTSKQGKGYKVVRFSRPSGKIYRSMFPVHRLVAIAFVPNPLNLPQVNHIDGNKFNNEPSNLEWVTCKQNIHHAWRLGLSKPPPSQLKHGRYVGMHKAGGYVPVKERNKGLGLDA
jgi:hypothetical protein